MPWRSSITPSVPNPDPTILTKEEIRREFESLHAQLSARIDGIQEQFTTKVTAMDKAQTLFETNLTRVPTEVDKSISHLRDLHDEKFSSVQRQLEDRDSEVERAAGVRKSAVEAALDAQKQIDEEKFTGIQRQFIERDTRVEQTARDTKVAVDAALQAAEKAVGKQNESFALSIAKSETATNKQIDAQTAALGSVTTAIDGKISDLKERVGRIENQAIGWSNAESKQTVDHQTHTSSQGTWIAAAALIATTASILVSHLWK